MALNEIKISDLGLLNINRKIIDSRRYENELISTEGNVSIFESRATGFDTYSYLYKQELPIVDNSINITCSCNYSASETDQVAYLLKNEEHSIALHFNNEQARLLIDDVVKIQFSYLKLKDNTEIRTIIKISENTCNFNMYVHDLIFEKSAILEPAIDFSGLYTLFIGNEPNGEGNFWVGSIDLSTFTISEDSKIIYSPCANYPLTFSKIYISDGEFELRDNLQPAKVI